MSKQISKEMLSVAGIMLLFLVIVTYGYVKFRPIRQGVELSVALTDGTTVADPLLEISGTALHARRVTVNDRDIGVSPGGIFFGLLLLQEGYNIIEVYAEDRFGESETQTYRLMLPAAKS